MPRVSRSAPRVEWGIFPTPRIAPEAEVWHSLVSQLFGGWLSRRPHIPGGMGMRSVCQHCKKSFAFTTGVTACPYCGTGVHEALFGSSAVKAKVTWDSKKARARRAAVRASRGGGREPKAPSPKSRTKVVTGVLRRRGNELILYLLDRELRVRVTAPVSIETLEGYCGHWNVGPPDSDGTVPVSPKDSPELQRLVRIETALRSRPRTGRRGPSKVGPTAPGTSELELIGDRLDQLERIRFLSSQKDDPQAWAALANGYRQAVLRPPLEAAMNDVGVERIAALVRHNPGAWPPELLEWLDDREAQERKRRNAPKLLAKEAYLYGDYGTVET